MSNLKYRKMRMAELFAELRSVSIDANASVADGCSVRDQHLWMAMKYEICDEIGTRGPQGLAFFVSLLQDELPIMRLTGALNVPQSERESIIPVLEELIAGRYGGSIEVDARSALYDLFKRT